VSSCTWRARPDLVFYFAGPVQGLPDQVRAADLSASFEPPSLCSPGHRGWLERMVLAGSLMGEEAETERIPVQQAKASRRTDAHPFL
jgi:hypothetical protein